MITENWEVIGSYQLVDETKHYKRWNRLLINEREDGSWMVVLFWPGGMERARQRAAYTRWLEIGGEYVPRLQHHFNKETTNERIA